MSKFLSAFMCVNRLLRYISQLNRRVDAGCRDVSGRITQDDRLGWNFGVCRTSAATRWRDGNEEVRISVSGTQLFINASSECLLRPHPWQSQL